MYIQIQQELLKGKIVQSPLLNGTTTSSRNSFINKKKSYQHFRVRLLQGSG